MNSLFSDALFSGIPSPDADLDASWVSPRPSSIRNVVRYAQAFSSMETSLGPSIWLQN
ncbi:MAG: hypothetical protein VX101_00530 [Bacteroidota bacterium]|nr:hypothetical protein [Bacteroidota bacterium]